MAIKRSDWQYGDPMSRIGCCTGMSRIYFFLSANCDDEGNLCGWELSGRLMSSSYCAPLPVVLDMDEGGLFPECPPCDSVRFTNVSQDWDSCVFYASMEVNYCGGYCDCPTTAFFGLQKTISQRESYNPCREEIPLITESDGNVIYRAGSDGRRERVPSTVYNAPKEVKGCCPKLVPLFEEVLRDADMALVLPPPCNCSGKGDSDDQIGRSRRDDPRYDIPHTFTDAKGRKYTTLEKRKTHGRKTTLKEVLGNISTDELIGTFREALNNPDGNSRHRSTMTGKIIPASEAQNIVAKDEKFEEFKKNIKYNHARKGYGILKTEAKVPEKPKDGPFAVDGYYPLYRTAELALFASPTPGEVRKGENTRGYHTHVLGGVTYYMPNGLGGPGSGKQFHGDYTGSESTTTQTSTTTSGSSSYTQTDTSSSSSSSSSDSSSSSSSSGSSSSGSGGGNGGY